MSNAIEQADWKVHWKVTESAGLMIYLASYAGRRVLWEGSLPYVTDRSSAAAAVGRGRERRRGRTARSGPRSACAAWPA